MPVHVRSGAQGSMVVMDEMVGVYDEDWAPAGSAPRSRVRAENLRHAGTAVVLRNSRGEVYVHRRTDTKDVFPGLHDFAAGGVMQAGEDPLAAAERELAEELGVSGVELVPLGTRSYEDSRTRYWAHCFTATSDGPVRWQPEEVAWGEWVPATQLVERLEQDPDAFVPDTWAVLGDWLRDQARA